MSKWPTLDEVRQQLWDTTQRLYQRVGHLEGTLIGVREQLVRVNHNPDIERLTGVIDAALKESKQ